MNILTSVSPLCAVSFHDSSRHALMGNTGLGHAKTKASPKRAASKRRFLNPLRSSQSAVVIPGSAMVRPAVSCGDQRCRPKASVGRSTATRRRLPARSDKAAGEYVALILPSTRSCIGVTPVEPGRRGR